MGKEVVVALLGGFSVTADGSVFDDGSFERRSGAQLVQLLALSPGQRRHREQVFDALWPEAPMETAANRLYQAASHARKALGTPEAVVLRGQVVALFPDRDVRVDVDILESADLNDADSCAVALSAWGGELLADSPYAEWATDVRNRVRRRYEDLLLAAGRWHTLVELDPTNEEAHVALMRDGLQAGDHRGVLRQFGVLEQVLAKELGVVPGPTAAALRDEATSRLADRTPSATMAGLRVFIVALGDDSQRDDSKSDHSKTEHAGNGDDADGPVRAAIEDAGGAIFEHDSPGTTAVFTSAVDAIGAAVGIQRVSQSIGDIERFRVAVDIGEAESHGLRWTGKAVDRAHSIAAAASGEQIVCSSLVADLVGSELDTGVQIVDLGLYRLPDQAPVGLRRVVVDGLADRTTGLRAGRVAGRAVEPMDQTTFGRENDIEALSRALESARLVTVIGPGGAEAKPTWPATLAARTGRTTRAGPGFVSWPRFRTPMR